MLDETDLVRFTAAGLYDPDSPTAGERLDLLRYLVEHGATFDDLIRFGREGRLPSLGGFLRRRRGRTLLTPRAVSEQGPFDLDEMARVWRASGFPAFDPDELLLTLEDVETFRAFVAGTELFGEDILLQFTRVLGAALASIADAAMATFGLNLAAALTESDASELEYARATAAATSVLLDGVPAAMSTLFFHHVEAAIQRFTLTQTGAGAEVAQLAVGFLDLEGSTTLMQQLPAREAGRAISDFEARASALVAASGGRVVKTLGDEVMFVMTDEAKACEVALQLRDYVGTHAVLPALRGALATGELVRGYGDYYGPVVTLAARAAKCAAPGTVVVTAAVCERAGAARDHRGLSFTSTGDHDLRGFDGAVELFAVERAEMARIAKAIVEASAEVARRDPAMRRIAEQVGPADLRRGRPRRTHFAELARAICYQQLAGAAASAIHGRFDALFDGEGPTPEGVLALPEATLRSVGLSGSKTASIRDLAQKVADGDVELDRVGRLSDDEIVGELTLVRGIGRWTAEMFLIFQLGRLDVWPVDDFGVRRGYGILHGMTEMPAPKALEPMGDAYRPYRSIAAWYCWRAADTRN